MSVGKICSRTMHLADAQESVQVAAQRMKDEHVGTLLVIDEERKPLGILTDRDLALRVVATGMDVRGTKVSEVMSAHPRWVSDDTPIETAVATMRSLAVRRLPVVDGEGKVVGIVSIDDVLKLVTEELGNVSEIVGWSDPGIALPVTRPPNRNEPPVASRTDP